MNHLNGEVSSEFPSKCDHSFITRLIAYPTDADFVLESCGRCEVIRNYNIQTGQMSIVCKGSTPGGICHGPNGSILTYTKSGWKYLVQLFIKRPFQNLFIMKWDKEHQELHTDKKVCLEHSEGWLNQMCYSELCDMLDMLNIQK